MLLALLAGACQSGKEQASGIIGSVDGFAGAVVADEPRAVLAARDALVAGGSAADAAVTLYFTLAVTLPTSAGLGGGGVCLVHDPDADRPMVLDFLPRASADGSFGLPGNVRGMAVLHAKYGRMQWGQLLASAEDLARGSSVSRALARDLAAADASMFVDPELHRAFIRPDGAVVGEGEGLQQLELIGSISQIRRDGAGAFYAGALAVRMALQAESIGLSLTGENLRAVQPEFREALSVNVGERAAYFAGPPADGGLLRAQLLALLMQGGVYVTTSESARPDVIAAASERASLDYARWLQSGGAEPASELLSPGHLQTLIQSDPASVATFGVSDTAGNHGTTGFVIADQDGLVVACEVTMNRLLGIGRTIPGTGVVLAAPPGDAGIPLGPMVAVSPDRGAVDYASAASGGLPAARGLISVFLDTALRGRPLADALAAKPEDAGQVNALWCPDGLPRDPDSCQARNDPRGYGLAVFQSD